MHIPPINSLFVPGTLLILTAPYLLWKLSKKIGLGLQFLIIALITGILVGPSVLGGQFPQLMTFLFPHGMQGIKFASDIAVIVMGLLAGIHISPDHKGHRDDVIEAEDGVVRSITNGPKLYITSVVTTLAQIVLAFLIAPILIKVAPNVIGQTSALLPYVLAVILPVIALPVLTAALIETGLIHKKVGKVAMQLSMNSEIYLWPALIALTAFAVGTGQTHGVAEHALSIKDLLIQVTAYLALMFIAIRPAIKWISSKNALIANILFIPVLIGSLLATEHLGLHTLLGAVVAGIISPHSLHLRVESKVKYIQFGLTPFFLMGVGLLVKFQLNNPEVIMVSAILVIVTSIVHVLLMSALASRLLQFFNWKGLAIGFLTIMKGMVEIVVSKQLADAGIISPLLSQAVILKAIVQTLIGPPLAKWALNNHAKQKIAFP